MNRLRTQLVSIRKEELEPAFLFFFFWFFVIVVFQVLKPLKKGLFVENLGAYVELYAKLGNVGVALPAVMVFTCALELAGQPASGRDAVRLLRPVSRRLRRHPRGRSAQHARELGLLPVR